MTKKLQVFRCDKCGAIVMVFHEGSGTLRCCQEPMRLLEENTTDAAREKHVPVIEPTASGYRVKVGSVAHPMDENHYIEWVELLTDNTLYCRFLHPGEAPEAEFDVKMEGTAPSVYAREYCTLHGYWKG